MSNNGPVLSRGSNAAVDYCRHSSLKRMISDKTMICIIHEQQLTSGLLRNIAPMKATFCNTWNMHCIKWICSSPPFGSIESIHATRTNLSISPFQSSMPSLTIRSSFACMEPTTGDESCIQMDRQGAFSTDKKTCRFRRADYPAFNTPDKCNGNGGADLTWPNETSHGCRL